ncbi:hypothetical+protein [Methylocapsa aurea]|uniref:hypothetical protein n=1 Tax=Methylocapsa aurea TaxID=663610 RepID=UPI003D18B864
MSKPSRLPKTSDARPAPAKQRGGRPRREEPRSAVLARFTKVDLSAKIDERDEIIRGLSAKLDVEIAFNNRASEIEAAKDKQIAGLYRDIRAINAQLRAESEENALLRNVVVDTAISSHANGSALRAAAKSRAISSAAEPSYPEAFRLDQATDGASR